MQDGSISVRGHSVNYLVVFNGSRCLHCRRRVSRRRQTIAIGAPYHGVLHIQCAPLYQFQGVWPHQEVQANLLDTVPLTSTSDSSSSESRRHSPPLPAALPRWARAHGF